jgi:hypothetical protein
MSLHARRVEGWDEWRRGEPDGLGAVTSLAQRNDYRQGGRRGGGTGSRSRVVAGGPLTRTPGAHSASPTSAAAGTNTDAQPTAAPMGHCAPGRREESSPAASSVPVDPGSCPAWEAAELSAPSQSIGQPACAAEAVRVLSARSAARMREANFIARKISSRPVRAESGSSRDCCREFPDCRRPRSGRSSQWSGTFGGCVTRQARCPTNSRCWPADAKSAARDVSDLPGFVRLRNAGEAESIDSAPPKCSTRPALRMPCRSSSTFSSLARGMGRL